MAVSRLANAFQTGFFDGTDVFLQVSPKIFAEIMDERLVQLSFQFYCAETV